MDWGVSDMQPLSRVLPKVLARFGEPDTMQQRPKLAIKIAECVTQFASFESLMGVSISIMLHSDATVVHAMYAALENRSAQLRVLQACAKAKLNQDQASLMTYLISLYIKPLMRRRDRLAHWVWGVCDELPDALLTTDTTDRMLMHMGVVGDIVSPFDTSKVFVVKEPYLSQFLAELFICIDLYREFIGTFWARNSLEVREQMLHLILAKPPIWAWFDRQKTGQEKTPSTPQPHNSPKITTTNCQNYIFCTGLSQFV